MIIEGNKNKNRNRTRNKNKNKSKKRDKIGKKRGKIEFT